MTIVYFVQSGRLREHVPGFARTLPVGVGTDGKWVSEDQWLQPPLAVLLLEDVDSVPDGHAAGFNLADQITPVLHRTVESQRSWLACAAAKGDGLAKAGSFSHQPTASTAYEYLRRICGAPNDTERQTACAEAKAFHDTDSQLGKLEELAAWLAVRERHPDTATIDNSYVQPLLGVLESQLPEVALNRLRYDSTSKFSPVKSPADLRLEDIESAADALIA